MYHSARLLVCVLGLFLLCSADIEIDDKKHHKKHHHHRHHDVSESSDNVADVTQKPSVALSAKDVHVKQTQDQILSKMKELEDRLAKAEAVKQRNNIQIGHLEVNGPLPEGFPELFAKAVAAATGCDASTVKITESNDVSALLQMGTKSHLMELTFEAPADVIKAVEDQAADPHSKLANGALHSFLVEDNEVNGASVEVSGGAAPAPGPAEGNIDMNIEMPYGDLEPFGREDTAQELTEGSIKESDAMVDQLEKAEVAEEKRAVFRALTRLRGAAITSFDGIARSQTGNIDEYNKNNQWRKDHPLHHLAAEEADVSKWAFPDNADFIQTKGKAK